MTMAESGQIPEGKRISLRKQCVLLAALCIATIAIFGRIANSGMLECLGSSAQDSYYNLLVDGFRNGQLNLKLNVPEGFARLQNPYDYNASKPYLLAPGAPL